MKKIKRFIIISLSIVIAFIITGLFLYIYFPSAFGVYVDFRSPYEDISMLNTAVITFYLSNSRFPTCEEGLEALVPYLHDNKIPKDPWGNSYFYISPGPNDIPYGIFSFGADGISGGAKDFYSWNRNRRFE